MIEFDTYKEFELDMEKIDNLESMLDRLALTNSMGYFDTNLYKNITEEIKLLRKEIVKKPYEIDQKWILLLMINGVFQDTVIEILKHRDMLEESES